MKRKLKAVLGTAVATGFAGLGLAALATPAFAGTNPPFEPDPNAAAPLANVLLFDANGNQITSGTSLSSPPAYIVATTNDGSGATKAELTYATPTFGEVTASWPTLQTGGPTTFSALPAATPTDIKAFAAAGFPVVSGPSAFSTYLASHPSDTNAGYANTLQIRLFDTPNFGTTTYWDTDIAYNSGTSGNVSVDGNSVAPGNWLQVFPSVTATTTTCSTSATGGHLASGSPITITANVPAGDAGTVQFYDGSTILSDVVPTTGTSTFSYTPAQGSHSYSASFIPGGGPTPTNPGDETGNNTAAAAIIGGSSCASIAVSDTPPQTGTTTSLSAGSTSINYGASDTFTATVGAADNSTTGVGGSVEFLDGTTAISGCSAQPTTVTGAGTTASPGVGTATCSTSALPQGSNSITAVFTPTSNSYATSTSAAVVVTVAAPAACSLTGSSCSDTQNIQVTINPGTITITTPYTATNPFVLPAMTLSSDGTFFQSSATFPASALPGTQQIVVTSSLAPAQTWTLSVAASALSDGTGGTIPASGLGLTGGALLNNSGPGAYPGTVSFTGIPALNPSPIDGAGTGPGLSTTPQNFATSTAADGTAEMDGTLTLFAATGTPAGTYTGTITFSVS